MNLAEFLVYAKKQRYASGQEPQKGPDGAHLFGVAAEGWTYRDRYYDSWPFAGQEIVWGGGNRAVWCMHYYGWLIPPQPPTKEEISSVLRWALEQVPEAFPVRGSRYAILWGHFSYRANIEGTLERFSGWEHISYMGVTIYKCEVHGGRL